jgi:hypothetical protein
MHLSWKDKLEVYLFTPAQFHEWYSRIDSRWLIIHGESKEFKQFVYLAYGWKRDLLRYWFIFKRRLVTVFDLVLARR